MHRSGKWVCFGMGFVLAAVLLSSPTVGEQAKPAADRNRDVAGAASKGANEKPKPDAVRNGTNPFAGKVLVVERLSVVGGPLAIEKCEVIEISKVQLLSGRLVKQPDQPQSGLKLTIPFNAIGGIVEFENLEEYEEYQGRINEGAIAGPGALPGAPPPQPVPHLVPQGIEIAPQGIELVEPARPGPIVQEWVPVPGVQFFPQQPILPNWVMPYFDASRVTGYEDVAFERLTKETREAATVLTRAGAKLFVLSGPSPDGAEPTTPPEVIVLVGNEWTGGDAEAERAGKISTLLGVYVLGPGQVSDETLAKLRKSQPKAEIERRSEARLGIAGGMHPKGLLALNVEPNSAAGRAGIQPQDVIMELAGQPVPDFETYREVMIPLKPGEKVKMKVWRDGETMSVAVKLGRWE